MTWGLSCLVLALRRRYFLIGNLRLMASAIYSDEGFPRTYIRDISEKVVIGLAIIANPMCKFFKQPTDPIEAEEPDLAH